MNIESLREYCLSLPLTSEDMAFGDGILLFRVCGKIFGCCSLDGSDRLVVKSDPDVAIVLRDEHAEIEPAYHWNKKYWIEMPLGGRLGDAFLQSLIRRSYAEVVRKFPLRMRREHPEITEVE